MTSAAPTPEQKQPPKTAGRRHKGDRPLPARAATAARLDALTVSILGNVEELRASERLNYERVEGGIADCMRAHGRAYGKPEFVDLYEGFTDADLGYGNGRGTIVDSLTAGTRRADLTAAAGARMKSAEVAMRLVAGRIDAWQDRHAGELQAVRREWQRRVRAARGLPR